MTTGIQPRKRAGSSRKAAEQRRALFVDTYLAKGENGTQAYMQVWNTNNQNVAAVEAHKLLRRPNIQEAIEKRRAQIRAKFGLNTERITHELGRIAYFNPKKMVDANGLAIPLHKLDDDTAAALATVETVETTVTGKGKDKVVTTKVFKGRPFNKVSAIGQANKILRLYDKPLPPPPAEDGEPTDYRETVRRIAFELRREEALQEKEARIARPPVKHKKIKVAG